MYTDNAKIEMNKIITKMNELKDVHNSRIPKVDRMTGQNNI